MNGPPRTSDELTDLAYDLVQELERPCSNPGTHGARRLKRDCGKCTIDLVLAGLLDAYKLGRRNAFN